MKDNVFCNDYYEISGDYRLLAFNQPVVDRHPGIKVGDKCYKALMKREMPCLHCPVAGNSDCDCPVRYDPFYENWMEAIFAKIGEDRYSVINRPARDRGMRVFDSLGKDDNEDLIRQVAGRAVNDQLLALERELKDKQLNLEACACEQEAQLEEIISLNGDLQEKQARLEKLTVEQELQKEELREAKEAAEAASNAKTAFLFHMSHDIRTPMNAIMGFRDLLEKHQDDPARRQGYLDRIKDSSKVLLSIINNVLEMARIEKGNLEVDEVGWSTEQFIDTIYSIFAEMMRQKGIKYTRKVDVVQEYVFCDPVKLRDVFINILSNAYKYTNPGGSVHMELKELPCDREGWTLYQTTISDTGIGMSKEFLPHVFEEFAREHNTTDNKIEGTGLGMPIVKRLVEFMNGTIEVHSKKGQGTRIVVTIPHRVADKSNLVEKAGTELDPRIFAGKRILLAEDNDLNAEIAEEILKEVGFLVERAENGRVCLEKLAAAADNYYDLVLMDIQMPEMNGYEAARSIRQLTDCNKAIIPILAMTANVFEEDKREAYRSGMNGHLGKPIEVKTLMKELAALLK